MRLAAAAAALLLATPAVRAEEGMWMPSQLPDLAPRLRALGFAGDPAAFADLAGHPMGAVASLGGCSASFVSPDGLVATNHHCAIGALQMSSTPERDLLRDGFLAKTRAEEPWAGPGSRLYVTVRVTEVTEAIAGGIDPGLSDRARGELLERRVKGRVAACEQGGLRCRVDDFLGGLRWFEVAQLEIQDVRLAYAPPSGIGNFGGETDNWRWPRHAGDFTLLRAYVGPDGKPARHAAGNVPYRPAHWLRVAPGGAAEGELVLVAGFPAETRRLETATEVREALTWGYPRVVRRAREQLALLEELARKSRETGIRVESRIRGLANVMKNHEGVLEGAERTGLLQAKRAAEEALQRWIAERPSHRARYRGAVERLDALEAARLRTRERDAVLAALLPERGGTLLAAARSLWRLAEERPRPDLDRALAYQERNWVRLREAQLRLDRTLDLAADRVLLRYVLAEASALPAGQRLAPLDEALGLHPGMPAAAAAARIEPFLDRLYAGTRLADRAVRLSLLEKPAAELRALRDPFLELAALLVPAEREAEDRAREREGALSRVRPLYVAALQEKAGRPLAPDANGTLRLTFGTVAGVSPRDGLRYEARTRLSGILEKHRAGDPEFEAPAALLAAIRAGRETPWRDPALGDVPVDALSSLDTTGGNSGSPVLNARGELVGLLFDGTWESVAADFLHEPRARSIHVDVRYLLWVLSEVAGARPLLEEMGAEAPAAVGGSTAAPASPR
jgi:hypothetical protein